MYQFTHYSMLFGLRVIALIFGCLLYGDLDIGISVKYHARHSERTHS